MKGLPRGGEHLLPPGAPISGGDAVGPGDTGKVQEPQSPFVMILPYIEQQATADRFDIRFRYNDPAQLQNQLAAQSVPPILLCPTNPYASLRPGGLGKDSAGFGCTDYGTVPYQTTGTTLVPTAVTGKNYPASAYVRYSAADPLVDPGKVIQLDRSQLQAGLLDGAYGLPTLDEIKDGTSNTMMIFEDCSLNEEMGRAAGKSYYDVFGVSGVRCHTESPRPGHIESGNLPGPGRPVRIRRRYRKPRANTRRMAFRQTWLKSRVIGATASPLQLLPRPRSTVEGAIQRNSWRFCDVSVLEVLGDPGTGRRGDSVHSRPGRGPASQPGPTPLGIGQCGRQQYQCRTGGRRGCE